MAKAAVKAEKLTQTITVKRDAAEPEQVELLAKAILETSECAKKLIASGLTKRALIVLIHNLVPSAQYGKPQVNKTQIREVLEALPKLREFLGK